MSYGGQRSRYGAGIVFLLVVAVWAFSAPAAAANEAAWLPATSTGDAVDAVGPAMAMDDAGDVDELFSASGDLMSVDRVAGPGNAFGAATAISDGLNPVSAPEIAMDPAGDALAVWVEDDAAGLSQVWEAYAPAGSAYGGASEVAPSDLPQSAPQVALAPGGQAFITWVQGATPATGVVDAAVGTPGSLGTPAQLSSPSVTGAGDPQLAIDNGGDALIVWTQPNPLNAGEQQAAFSYRPAAATTWSTAQTVDGGDNGSESKPTVAMDDHGDATLVYELDDGAHEVLVEADWTGGQPGPTYTFSAPSEIVNDGNDDLDPQVSLDSSDDASLIWEDEDPSNDETEADAMVHPNGGTFSGMTPLDLGPMDNSALTAPHIVTRSNGSALAVWADSLDIINADTISAAGAAGTATTLSPTGGSETARLPVVAIQGRDDDPNRSEANGVAGWIQMNVASARTSVQAAGYDAGYGPTAVQLHIAANAVAAQPTLAYVEPFDVWPALGDPSTSAPAVSWNFGDGTGAATSGNVIHTYPSATAAGQVDAVQVTLTDALGNTSAYTQRVTVAGSAPSIPQGGIGQLAAPDDCIGSGAFGCGTLVQPGLLVNTFEPVVSADGRFVYVIAQDGGIGEFSRNATTGALTEIGCLTGPGLSLTGCTQVAELDNPAALVLSPDGTSAYVAGQGADGVIGLSRDPSTGLLSAPSTAICFLDPTVKSVAGCGSAAGLHFPYGIAISPDGRSVYVASAGGGSRTFADGGVAEFSRAANGALTPIGSVVTDDVNQAIGVTVSPDGSSVYVATGGTQTSGSAAPFGDIAEFSRNQTSGVLTAIPGHDCIGAGTIGGFSCPDAAPSINGTEDLAIAPSGGFVYANTFGDDGVVELARNAATGVLSQIGCVATSETPAADGCSPGAVGLLGDLGVAVSADGDDLYSSGASDNAEAAFAIDPSSGLLSQLAAPHNCITSNAASDASTAACGTHDATGLDGARRVAVSPDGTSVYVAGQSGIDDDIAEMTRTPVPARTGPTGPTGATTGVTGPTGGTTGPTGPTGGPTGPTGGPTGPTGPTGGVTGGLRAPVLDRTANLDRVSGTVRVKEPGSRRYVAIQTVAQVRIGATVDATHGVVQLTVALPGGGTETGEFYGGAFVLRQAKDGRVTAVLTGGSFTGCPAPPRQRDRRRKARDHDARIAKAEPKGHPVRHLWADGHGSFTTQGRYGSAAVLGTKWLTRDQCDGTYFYVARDKILVTSFTLHNHKQRLRLHRHYLAPAPGYERS